MKIAVVGYSGAGKSTLAAALGERLALPVLHLDTVQFLPGWRERDREEAREMVRAFLERPGWVIDGNYTGFLYGRRMEEADRIIFLDLPRRVCFYQAWRRYRANRGRVRESMAPGCEEKFDAEFILWLLWGGRTGEKREGYRRLRERFPHKMTVCRSRKEIAALLCEKL